MSADEARAAARAALVAGDAQAAGQIAAALLERDAADAEAGVMLSAALLAQGHAGRGAQAARAAWRNASRPDGGLRFNAAMLAARGAHEAGHHGSARLWLRRAADAAPGAEERALALANFRHVGRVRPWQVRLDFGVQPSSNLNNGAAADVVLIGGVPFLLSGDAVALSGLGAHLAVEALRSLPGGRHLGVTAYGRGWVLSPEARAQAPGRRGSDYALLVLEGHAGFLRGPRAEGGWGLRGRATLGRNWYGGRLLSDYLRTELARAGPIAPGLRGETRLSLERQVRRDQPGRSAVVAGLGGTLQRRGPTGDLWTLSGGLRHTSSGSAEIAHDALHGALGWEQGQPAMGLRLGAAMELEGRAYHRAGALSPAPRRDVRAVLRASATMEGMARLGYAPRIELRAARTDSSLPIHSVNDISLSLGFRSTF
ncbi:MAG: hypothetical protein JJU40_03085 [Rhodobacteraceae bacterium]|nr:hypothetical protein [Paracoccaceae bacterium]